MRSKPEREASRSPVLPGERRPLEDGVYYGECHESPSCSAWLAGESHEEPDHCCWGPGLRSVETFGTCRPVREDEGRSAGLVARRECTGTTILVYGFTGAVRPRTVEQARADWDTDDPCFRGPSFYLRSGRGQ